MRILVVEDNPLEQEAARLQLSGQALTIMSYLELERKKRWMDEQDYGKPPETREWSFPKFMQSFEVLLTDLFMPTPQRGRGAPLEVPVGFCVLLMGLKCGIKNIGLLTNIHRHHSPIANAIDYFLGAPLISVGDTRIALSGSDSSTFDKLEVYHPERDGYLNPYSPEDSHALQALMKEAETNEDSPYLKDWGRLYRALFDTEQN